MIRLVPAIRFRDDPRATRRIDDEPARSRLATSILLVLDHGTLQIFHGNPEGLRSWRRGNRQILFGTLAALCYSARAAGIRFRRGGLWACLAKLHTTDDRFADVGTGRRRMLEQHTIEVRTKNLIAGDLARRIEFLDAPLARRPPHRVASGPVEAGAVDEVERVDRVEQLLRAGRQRLAEAARTIDRLVEDADRVAPG